MADEGTVVHQDTQAAQPEETHKLPPLDVRAFHNRDRSDVIQLIADDTLQLSRLSNALIYLHPIFLALWGAALAIISRYTRIFQKRDWGRGLLLFCCITSFFLVAAEWYNRTYWEKKTKNILDADVTLKDIPKHYGNDQFLVATLGDNMLIGLVGIQVDGRIATVKHWHVKAKYRSRGLGWDLLQWVIEISQKGGKKAGSLQRVRCQTYNLQRRAEKTLRDHAFVRVGETVAEPGLLGWFGVCLNTWEKTL